MAFWTSKLHSIRAFTSYSSLAFLSRHKLQEHPFNDKPRYKAKGNVGLEQVHLNNCMGAMGHEDNIMGNNKYAVKPVYSDHL